MTQTQLIVSFASPYVRQRYQVIEQDWDMGGIVALGNTIPEALEEYLEMHELKFNEELTAYSWRADTT